MNARYLMFLENVPVWQRPEIHIAITCVDSTIYRRLMTFAKEIEAYFRDTGYSLIEKVRPARPAEVVLVTAAAGGLACSCNCTDRKIALQAIGDEQRCVYEVHLLYHLNCGGVSIHSVALADQSARLRE